MYLKRLQQKRAVKRTIAVMKVFYLTLPAILPNTLKSFTLLSAVPQWVPTDKTCFRELIFYATSNSATLFISQSHRKQHQNLEQVCKL